MTQPPIQVPFVVYDDTGTILRNGLVPPKFLALQAGAGEHVIEGDGSDATHYVQAGELVEKQPMPVTIIKAEILADAADEAIIDNVPSGTRVWHGAHMEICDDGTVEFSTSLPGEHEILLVHRLYLTETVTITAT